MANLVGLDNRAPASLASQGWARWQWLKNLHWDWIKRLIQVGFAVVGTAIAAAITHTRVVQRDPLRRPVARKARRD